MLILRQMEPRFGDVAHPLQRSLHFRVLFVHEFLVRTGGDMNRRSDGHDGAGKRSDIVLIGDLAKNMLGRTFCPLGDAAAMPTISIVEKFYDEFEAHLDGRPCPHEHANRLVMA